MFYVSEISMTAPAVFKSDLQKSVYETLQLLNIAYQRVDSDEAISMNDCIAINQKLDVEMVKTLFLCNRQQTEFYMLVTKGDKPFRSKDFSHALGVARVSFAPAEKLYEMLCTHIGATTVLSLLNDKDNRVQIIFDKEVMEMEWCGCSDGTTTSYLKLRMYDIIHSFLNFTHHVPKIITI